MEPLIVGLVLIAFGVITLRFPRVGLQIGRQDRVWSFFQRRGWGKVENYRRYHRQFWRLAPFFIMLVGVVAVIDGVQSLAG